MLESPGGELGGATPLLNAWAVGQDVDGPAGTQNMNPIGEKPGRREDGGTKGYPECQPWVCCMTLGKLLTFLSQFPHL